MKKFLERLITLWLGPPASEASTPEVTAPVSETSAVTTPGTGSNSQSILLQLPPEMVLAIADQSHLDDVAALSLCCRALFGLLCPRETLTGAERERFLVRLERDLGASHYYCSLCVSLHGFSPLELPRRNRPWRFDKSELSLDFNSCRSMEICPLVTRARLTYRHGRLMMNRHFYGSPAGRPLIVESLKDVATQWSTTVTARIIRDELVLQRTLMLESTDLETLWRAVEEEFCYICEHLRANQHVVGQEEQCYFCKRRGTNQYVPGQKGYCHFCRLNAEKYALSQTLPPAKPYKSRLMLDEHKTLSCRDCLTDCSVEVTQVSEEPVKHTITVTVYHVAGSFRHHLDWKWRALMRCRGTPFTHLPRPYRDFNKYPLDCARKLWMSVDDEAANEEGRRETHEG